MAFDLKLRRRGGCLPIHIPVLIRFHFVCHHLPRVVESYVKSLLFQGFKFVHSESEFALRFSGSMLHIIYATELERNLRYKNLTTPGKLLPLLFSVLDFKSLRHCHPNPGSAQQEPTVFRNNSSVASKMKCRGGFR